MDTIIIDIPDKMLIFHTVKESFNYEFWVPTVIAILSILFIIWDKVKWPKISGKIISMSVSPIGSLKTIKGDGSLIEIKGIKYFIKISINTVRKNIYYKDIEVYVKYPSANKSCKARPYWSHQDYWTFTDGKTMKLSVPDNQFLWFNNIIEKDKVLFYYLTFFVENKNFEDFEQIEIHFINENKHKRKLKRLRSQDLKIELALFDPMIWEKS